MMDTKYLLCAKCGHGFPEEDALDVQTVKPTRDSPAEYERGCPRVTGEDDYGKEYCCASTDLYPAEKCEHCGEIVEATDHNNECDTCSGRPERRESDREARAIFAGEGRY